MINYHRILNVDVRVFGSTSSFLFSSESDVDLFTEKLLKDVLSMLKSSPEISKDFSDITHEHGRDVPIVKLKVASKDLR